jgi:hypothetical protein
MESETWCDLKNITNKRPKYVKMVTLENTYSLTQTALSFDKHHPNIFHDELFKIKPFVLAYSHGDV